MNPDSDSASPVPEAGRPRADSSQAGQFQTGTPKRKKLQSDLRPSLKHLTKAVPQTSSENRHKGSHKKSAEGRENRLANAAVPQSIRVCRSGNGLHYNAFGEQVNGAWRMCQVVPAHCMIGRGWYVTPDGREVYGTLRNCRFKQPFRQE